MTEATREVLSRALELPPAERVKVARELLASAGVADPGLRPADVRLRALFEHSLLPIGFSRDGVTIDASPAYARIFGFESGSELIGTSILDVIAPRARADIIDKVARRARGEDQPDTYETVGVRKDGTEFPFQVHVTRVVLEALEAIRRLVPTTPVVIVSGYGEEHAETRLAAHEGVAFVAKPYASSALADALRRVLGRARP